MDSSYPCPCCGYLVFSEPPGTYEICPVCDWEDDASQLRYARMAGGANRVSLLEAQQNFARFGTSEASFGHRAQPRADQYMKEKEWRPLNEKIDNIEDHATITGWSDIGAALYYWRDTTGGEKRSCRRAARRGLGREIGLGRRRTRERPSSGRRRRCAWPESR